MKRIIVPVWLGGIVLLFFPQLAFGGGVGLVPSSPIWFSKADVNPGETQSVYTVVVNNEYRYVDATLGFYANEVLLGKVDIHRLPQEHAEQVRVTWQPAPGHYMMMVRFLSATGEDAAGSKHDLDLASINAASGLPLTVSLPAPQAVTTSSSPVPFASSVSNQGQVASVGVDVSHQGTALVFTPSPAMAKSTGVLAGLTAQLDDIFAKNHAAIAKAEAIAGAVTSSIGAMNKTYEATKAVAAKGNTLYEKSQQALDRIAPWVGTVTGSNNPKRLLLIAGGTLGIGLWWRWRRRRFLR